MTQAEWMMLWLCAVAALLHGLSGFGFPMMSTAVLSSAYPLSIAVTLVILPCLLLNLIMLNADPAHSLLNSIGYYIKRYWPLMLSSLIGSVLGVKLLLWLNEAYLKLLLGLVIVFYVLDQLRARPLQVSPHISSMLCFGLLAGIIGGATNAMAPFLMMYLMSCQLSKTAIVIISNLNFIAGKLIQLVLLFPILITLETHQQHILIGISLFALAGVWIGGKIRHRLSQQHFKWIVLALLLGLGLYALWQSAGLLQQSGYSIFK
ncbi:sulfite exporter TauE/SafE family protein [Acinetobacter lwoffii]|uniref:sulfite exporter TauE/SafE family protein n=1 Tax=Acinetobacter lwoffii TaxID=28090 RepID=UPI00209AC6AA|nr:sulfite exporter TauE/SafE family protein [Acinetobacter lwoffii]MCO8097987.1 sulfite exporter TauE/SafE family protein [Acinetobacter lwoffii]